jgi:hypothetical protein
LIQNNGRIDVLTWLTARFAPLTTASINAIFQQALTTDATFAALQAPPSGPAPLPVAPKAAGPTIIQLENYVAAAFQDVLGRAASTADVAFWSGQLSAGLSRSAFANALTHSAEYYANVIITPAYHNYLGRAPDAAGLAFWTDRMLNHGLTDEQLEAGFIGSDEFFTTEGGGTNSGWIDALYMKLLGRPADAQGKAFWLAQLAGGESRAQVAYGFTSSVEREEQRVTDDYVKFLGRQPDQQGLNFWVNEFATGAQTNEDVIAGFVASDEYFSTHS